MGTGCEREFAGRGGVAELLLAEEMPVSGAGSLTPALTATAT